MPPRFNLLISALTTACGGFFSLNWAVMRSTGIITSLCLSIREEILGVRLYRSAVGHYRN